MRIYALTSTLLAGAFLACAGSRPSVAVLNKRLSHPDPKVRARSAETLASYGPQAAPALPKLLATFKDPERPVYEASAKAIRATGKDGVQALVSALSERDAWVRCRAAETLGAMGPEAADAVPALVITLGDKDFCSSGKAAGALARIGEAALPAVLLALKNPDGAIRRGASEAMAKMEPALQRQAAEVLAAGLADEDEFERHETAQRLTAMGPAAISVFAQRLKDKDDAVRLRAVDALAEIGDTRAGVTDAIAGLFDDPEPTLRLRAAVVLGKMGQRDAQVLSRLVPLLDEPDVDRRRGAVRAIGSMGVGGSRAQDRLAAMAADPADPLQIDAIEALYGIGTVDSLRAAESITRKSYMDEKKKKKALPYREEAKEDSLDR